MARFDGPASVLVVDDDADALEALVNILELEGFKAAGARNGRVALDYLRSHPVPDLIILDLMMPEMDGWSFRNEIKKDPVLASLPIVVVTAYTAAKVDVDAILVKPIDIERLFDTMDDLLARRAGHEGEA
ncbi:MAG: response regulator [Candidatus Binataceae bacterium]